MAVGYVASIAVCATGTGTILVSGQPVSCGTNANGGSMYLQWKKAYVVEPESAALLDGAIGPFDYEHAAAAFGVAFSAVMLLYWVGAGIGAVLDVIRRG
ncbi:hypothetical protein X963_622 [Burkholderia pseudomallei MSHR7498]|uniref:hypothetical protein n=1 Tax=Burkholderia pseudomallei TaxID=28450 RepID=UPI000531703F|nr:hypothetical protein [Burkholderia pseudomallei]KGS94983.1 hypothetical protein X963_622 [Burkholderia pseudomallei MSHR7498]